MANKIRAAAILIRDDNILLIHRTRHNHEFYVFPGGKKEDNESVEEAVVREVKEEASIKCEIIKLLYTLYLPDLKDKHVYYLCQYISGAPRLGNYNEMETMQKEDQTYKPVWLKIETLTKKLIYPLEIRDWVIRDHSQNFQDPPKTVTLISTDLRQEL